MNWVDFTHLSFYIVGNLIVWLDYFWCASKCMHLCSTQQKQNVYAIDIDVWVHICVRFSSILSKQKPICLRLDEMLDLGGNFCFGYSEWFAIIKIERWVNRLMAFIFCNFDKLISQFRWYQFTMTFILSHDSLSISCAVSETRSRAMKWYVHVTYQCCRR